MVTVWPWRAFIRRSQAEVWRVCAHLVDRDEAEDVTQEVFLRAWGALPAFRGDASARTWLLVVARRACADAVPARRLRRLLGGQPAASGFAEAEPTVDPAEGGVGGLVRRLDPDRRSAFVLTQMLDLSYGEAATVCGCSVGTIRSRGFPGSCRPARLACR
jgi:RNA polymerase sigma-70 factor (ECF subfamily)